RQGGAPRARRADEVFIEDGADGDRPEVRDGAAAAAQGREAAGGYVEAAEGAHRARQERRRPGERRDGQRPQVAAVRGEAAVRAAGGAALADRGAEEEVSGCVNPTRGTPRGSWRSRSG